MVDKIAKNSKDVIISLKLVYWKFFIGFLCVIFPINVLCKNRGRHKKKYYSYLLQRYRECNTFFVFGLIYLLCGRKVRKFLKIRQLQELFDYSEISQAKELIVFFVPPENPMWGGIMSTYSLCEYTRQFKPEAACVICTYPQTGKIDTYFHQTQWRSDEKIYNFDVLLDHAVQVEKVMLHLPEFLSAEEGIYSGLSQKNRAWLEKRLVRINILNQRTDIMPAKEHIGCWHEFTDTISMTTGHVAYATQETSSKYDLPLKHIGVHLDLKPYASFKSNKIEKIILYSYDNNAYKKSVLSILKKGLPDYQLIEIEKLTFEECMKLTSKSLVTISFGEGFDGYFLHPLHVGRLGIAVYNDTFFPSEDWKDMPNVYSSFEEMKENIVNDIRYFEQNQEAYQACVEKNFQKQKSIYIFEEYLNNLKDFYDDKYDFYPKRTVYIVGGNGFARECYYNLLKMIQNDPSIHFGGFMGHGGYGHTVDYLDLQKYYIGEVSEYEFKQDEYVIIGAGYPELRGKIYQELKERNINFFTLCPNGAFLKPSAEIGESNIFIPPSSPSCNIKIGNNNVFNGGNIIGHDVRIGDNNFFAPYSHILGTVSIGSNNTVGTNAIILPHAKIGNNNKIAPLSVIYKGCRHNSYWAGNPAVKEGDVE